MQNYQDYGKSVTDNDPSYADENNDKVAVATNSSMASLVIMTVPTPGRPPRAPLQLLSSNVWSSYLRKAKGKKCSVVDLADDDNNKRRRIK
jgi:hypothetical protein